MAAGADHSTAAHSFTAFADLASTRVGGRAVAANDEFFAPKANLLLPAAPVFIPGKFTSRGKWMDGWETRRRRAPGHDWCVVELGMRGVLVCRSGQLTVPADLDIPVIRSLTELASFL